MRRGLLSEQSPGQHKRTYTREKTCGKGFSRRGREASRRLGKPLAVSPHPARTPITTAVVSLLIIRHQMHDAVEVRLPLFDYKFNSFQKTLFIFFLQEKAERIQPKIRFLLPKIRFLLSPSLDVFHRVCK